ncbi:hypothetical protein BGZ88_002402 [Linnemannia elongata]|nr:hypothetical protein BGZ88_002402 [Linnemannia elongata]
MLWGTNIRTLATANVVLEGATGLSPIHRKLLVQGGAIENVLSSGDGHDFKKTVRALPGLTGYYRSFVAYYTAAAALTTFEALRQGKRTVAAYTHDFRRLCRRAHSLDDLTSLYW